MFDTVSEHPIMSLLLSPSATLFAAVIASIAAIRGNVRAEKNASDLAKLKSATDRDLARLNSKLAQGQLISTTQWNAEFGAYQALWSAFVPVRTIARKIVLREGELTELGLESGDVSEEVKIENIRKLLQQYAAKSSECVSTINKHAPFYAADIRKKSNAVHALAHQIFQTNLALLVARQKGQPLAIDTESKRNKELDDLTTGTDAIEEMIRKRMNEVQVFNPASW